MGLSNFEKMISNILKWIFTLEPILKHRGISYLHFTKEIKVNKLKMKKWLETQCLHDLDSSEVGIAAKPY